MDIFLFNGIPISWSSRFSPVTVSGDYGDTNGKLAGECLSLQHFFDLVTEPVGLLSA